MTYYAAWKAAVAKAGLSVRNDPPCHEGMHEDDAYQPVFAVDSAGAEFGHFANLENGDHEAVLFDTPEAYVEWLNETVEWEKAGPV